jgi:hypothetical protein
MLSGTAKTATEKVEAIKAQFFPPKPNADLSDIPIANYPPERLLPLSTSKEVIFSSFKMSYPFNAAGSDGIPFFVLKSLRSSLVSYLKPLFQACIDFSYFPTVFGLATAGLIGSRSCTR